MLFTSFTYILFLCLVIPLVRSTEGVWRERVLLGASLVYYAAWDVRFVALLLALGVFTHAAGHRIAAARKSGTKPRFGNATAPVVAILLVLAAFKYTRWLMELQNALGGTQFTLPKIILPLGICSATQLREPEALTALYEAKGVKKDKEVYALCQTGQRSSVSYLVLRLLGYPKVGNYAGSWVEWGNDEATPKTQGA